VLVDRGPGALIGGDLLGALAGSLFIATRLRRTVPTPPTSGDRPTIRAVLREGIPFQGFSLVVASRDLATALFVSVLVGTRDLGLLQFAYRVLSPVLIVFQSIGQLAVPVGAQVLRRDDRAQRQVQTGFLVTGAITAVILATAAAPAHWLVPHLFGARWNDAVGVVAAIALALVISGPINSLGVGLLVAAGRVGVAALAVGGCTVWFMGSMAALLPLGGVTAGALAWVGMAAVESTIVVVACRRLLQLPLARPTVIPAAVFAVAYAAGSAAGNAGQGWLSSSLLATAAALAVSLGLSSLIALRPFRSLLRDARRPVPPPEVAAGALT
jgi:O-antigen/teichoic acid export membrane protein